MTDSRLAAAVEAAARVAYADDFHVPVSAEWRTEQIQHYWHVQVQDIVEAALAAADAWDREHGIDAPSLIIKIRGNRLSRKAAAQIRAAVTAASATDPDEPREPRPVPR